MDVKKPKCSRYIPAYIRKTSQNHYRDVMKHGSLLTGYIVVSAQDFPKKQTEFSDITITLSMSFGGNVLFWVFSWQIA